MKCQCLVYCLLLCSQVCVAGARLRSDSVCTESVVVMLSQSPEHEACYRQGWQMSVAGDVLMPVGVATALAAGLPLLLWGDWRQEGLSDLGKGLMCMGAAAVVVSIPLVAVGKRRCNRAYEEFMFDCLPFRNGATAEEPPAVALHLQTSANGMGLALHF